MGFLDFFKKKRNTKPEGIIFSAQPIPTIEAPKELFVLFAEIFQKEMATITALSKNEIKDMYDYIANGEGGYLNQSHYHKIIFERYFKDREWSWSEYENKEDDLFRPIMRPFEQIEKKEALEMLKVSEIKEFLQYYGVSFKQKDSKKVLIDLVLNEQNLLNSLYSFPAMTKAMQEYVTRRRFSIYSTLILTITFRTKHLYDRQRSVKLGVTKEKWIYCSACGHSGHKEAHEKIFNLFTGLKINGKYLYPGDSINCMCMSRSIFPGFDDKAT
jgi:hypothetical protein